mgnify:FL=1
MIYSKYNIYVRTKSNGLLIYNTLYGRVIKLTEEYYNQLDLTNPENCSKEVLAFLSSNNMITTEESENERLNFAETRFVNKINSTLFITLIPSFKCNFNCPYCYENHASKDMLNQNNYNNIVDEIISTNIKNVNIHLFGGEPLLFINDICIFLDKLKEKDFEITGGITTNGYLLNEEVFNKLLEYGITSFQITIDGNKESHNKTRKLLNGGETYSTILQNLINISHDDSKFNIVVRCNLDSLTEVNEFLKDYICYFNNDKRFSLLLYPVSNWNESSNCETLISKEELFKNYTKKLKDEHINDSYLTTYINGLLCCDFSFPTSFALLPNGKVGFCTIDFSKDKQIEVNDYFSNLKSNLNQKSLIIDECKTCPLYPKCFGYGCKKRDKSNHCDSLLNNVKAFLLEYFL